MKKPEFMNNLSRTISKAGLSARKHSPEVLIVVGIAGVVGSAVMACKATTKVSEIIEETKSTIDTIHSVSNDPNMAEKYSKEDSQKDLAIVYTQTGIKLAKLYGPSILLGAASIGCILMSHNIISKRNAALTAAFTAVNNNFKDYRKRLIDRFGEKLDEELRFNIKSQEVEEVVKDENGNETVVKKTVDVAHPGFYSEYAKCFDETCLGWTRDAEINLMTLKQVQNWANERLKTKGYLFLNEIYEALGIPKTRAGHVVGWVYDESNPVGDNFVDFGIYNLYIPENREFVNGYEQSIWLDFNVDGNIYDLVF